MSLNSASASSQFHQSPCVVVHSFSRFHRLGFSLVRHSHSSSQTTTARPLVLLHRHQKCPIHHKATSQNPKQQHPPPYRSRTLFNSQQRAVVDYRGAGGLSEDDEEGTRRRTRKGSTSTMDKIVERLKKFGYVDGGDDDADAGEEEKEGPSSLENIFYEEEDGGALQASSRGWLLTDPTEEEVRFPWEKCDGEDRIGGDAAVGRTPRKKKSHSSLAEETLPERELRRLRLLAIRTKSKTKIGGTGVTKEIVDKIHEKWKTEEVVRLKCEGPPALNMKRMHEILERKTGGTVIWRSGSSISLYRGVTYEPPKQVKHHLSGVESSNHGGAKSMVHYSQNGSRDKSETLLEDNVPAKKTELVSLFSDTEYDHEMDKLLESLGPRFTDWPGPDPLPVDADLLPGSVPGYSPPFRILPYGVRRSLSGKDQTALTGIARVLPPHFAIGRSRQLQGLAASIVKLWEKSSIAKITLKRRVQITTSERLAEELKKLTGGTLLCRNKDYIVFYRGKDFLSLEMTEALLEREQLAKSLQDEEEHARLKASSPLSSIEEKPAIAGTLSESLEADARWGKQLDDNVQDTMVRAAEVERHAVLVKRLERKLSIAERRLFKAEKALGKVEEFLKPAESKPDPDSITDEERFMFRKLGLRMKAFLLLGRRGIFDGTVENMHLHWKYRELVKIIVKAKTFGQVKKVALSLEAESGGVLVSVDKVSKGFAVIVYRGKGYKRPPSLRPKNLLTKRKALARSIEMQRRESVCRHISNLRRRTKALKSELDQMKAVEEHGDVELYARLDSSYLSDDEESEDEVDEAHLETFDCGIDFPSDGSNNHRGQIDSEMDENNYNLDEAGECLDARQKDFIPHSEPQVSNC